MVIVAQLVRVSDCGSEGRGFKFLLSPNKYGALVKLVIMPPCHGGVHEFDPRMHRLNNFKYTGKKLKIDWKDWLATMLGGLIGQILQIGLIWIIILII